MMALTAGVEVPDCGRRHGHAVSYGGCGYYGTSWVGGPAPGYGYAYGGVYAAFPYAPAMPPGAAVPYMPRPGQSGPRQLLPPDIPGGINREDPRKKGTSAAPHGPAPATIVVHLPADARLTVDGEPTRATSERRTFITNPLTPGEDYYYRMEAQVLRDGRPVTASRKVFVRAGQRAEVSFELPAEAVARR
jgi:uncharacterized protein (TIGR03000 family)